MMRRLGICMLAVLLGVAGCGSEKAPETTEASAETAVETVAEESETPETIANELVNPWTTFHELMAAEELFGAPYSLAEADEFVAEYLFNTEVMTYRVMEGLLEVRYGDDLVIRQGRGEEQDISGVYIDYPENDTLDDCGTVITLCGEEGQIMLALFSWNGFSYSVFTEEGTDLTFIAGLAGRVTGIDSEIAGDGPAEEAEAETDLYPEETLKDS